jgi:hypothetical protein
VADEKVAARKKGLHGWRAAAAVFGCGTLAAFGVFGILIGILSTLFNITSDGVGAEENPAGTSAEIVGEPQASIEPGDLDLCSRNLNASSEINLMRVGTEENYSDTAESGERRISDRCQWELIPDYNSAQNWNLEYSYEAVIESDEGGRIDVASDEYDSRVSELEGEFHSVESRGESDLADRSYFVYGEISPGVTGYVTLAQTRSAVYEMRIEAESDSTNGELVPEVPMYREIAKLVRISEVEFQVWIPGTD